MMTFTKIGRNQFQRRGDTRANEGHHSQHPKRLQIRQYAQERGHDDTSIRGRSDGTGRFFLPVFLKLFHLRERGEIVHAIEE